MDKKPVDKKLQSEVWFLMGIILIACIALGVIIAFLKLNYNLSVEYQVLIVLPIAVLIGIFCLYYMDSVNLTN